MSKKIGLAIIVFVVVLTVVIVSAYVLQSSTSRTIGVNVGDVFTYSMTGRADTYDENVTVPANFLDINKVDYYRVEIISVEYPVVSYVETTKFKNGTSFSYDGMVNVEDGGNSGGFWGIYLANLKKGSLTRPDVSDGVSVADTVMVSYLDGDRETNFVSAEGQFYDPTDELYTRQYYDYMWFYFDKETGILVGLKNMQIYSAPDIMLVVEYRLVESNVLQIPPNFSLDFDSNF
ncbi:MAG: hypothetical protein LBE76_08980 [Nitrososphaerota archaeon]|jgi:hypothetical protein|nr:hypothetical protein [Nitrososphaerota archaeon]